MGLGCAIISVIFIFYTACELTTTDTRKKLIHLKCDQLLHSYHFHKFGWTWWQCAAMHVWCNPTTNWLRDIYIMLTAVTAKYRSLFRSFLSLHNRRNFLASFRRTEAKARWVGSASRARGGRAQTRASCSLRFRLYAYKTQEIYACSPDYNFFFTNKEPSAYAS